MPLRLFLSVISSPHLFSLPELSSPTPHWSPRLSVFSPGTWTCGQGRRGTVWVKVCRKGHPVLCLVCSLWLPTSRLPIQIQGQRNKSEFQDSWGWCPCGDRPCTQAPPPAPHPSHSWRMEEGYLKPGTQRFGELQPPDALGERAKEVRGGGSRCLLPAASQEGLSGVGVARPRPRLGTHLSMSPTKEE